MDSPFFYSPVRSMAVATVMEPGIAVRGIDEAFTANSTDSIVGFRIFQHVLEANVAGQLDIVGHATARASKLVIDYEAILISSDFEEFVDDQGNRFRRWFAMGARVALAVQSFKADLSINAGTVALAAQAGLASARLEAVALGLGSTEFASKLPRPFDDFSDASALEKVGEAVSAGFAWLADESGGSSPGEMVEVLEPLGREAAGNPMDEARSMLFAALRVKKGDTLAQALLEVPKSEPPVDGELVEATYEALLGVRILDHKPDKEAQERARKWLASTG